MNKLKSSSSSVPGQSIVDRIMAAKHTVARQYLQKVICKATTEEVLGPKQKHIENLLQCTNDPNTSIPDMANLLIERTQSTGWVVSFKALITTHNLISCGHERFAHYLASSNCNFNANIFSDKTGLDVNKIIRNYAKYLNEKAVAYRMVGFDFCRIKTGEEDGVLRRMTTEQVLKTLPVLQAEIDALLDLDVSVDDLSNGVVNAAFQILFKDLARLLACYNDGMLNIIDKYYEMKRKDCREALDAYQKFLVRMDHVAQFLIIATNSGFEKNDIPDLTTVPSGLLDTLETHLLSLENGRKASAGTITTSPTGKLNVTRTNGVKSQVGTMPTQYIPSIAEDEKKNQEQWQTQSVTYDHCNSSSLNSALTSSRSAGNFVDHTTNSSISPPRSKQSPSNPQQDDPSILLTFSPSMPNFSSNFDMNVFLLSNNSFASDPRSNSLQHGSLFPETTVTAFEQKSMQTNSVVGQEQFSSPFSDSSLSSMRIPPGGGDLLTPLQLNSSVRPTGMSATTNGSDTKKNEKLIKDDLDSSLALLADNLSIKPVTGQLKKIDHKWASEQTEKRLTGGPAAASPPSWISLTAQQPASLEHPTGISLNSWGQSQPASQEHPDGISLNSWCQSQPSENTGWPRQSLPAVYWNKPLAIRPTFAHAATTSVNPFNALESTRPFQPAVDVFEAAQNKPSSEHQPQSQIQPQLFGQLQRQPNLQLQQSYSQLQPLPYSLLQPLPYCQHQPLSYSQLQPQSFAQYQHQSFSGARLT